MKNSLLYIFIFFIQSAFSLNAQNKISGKVFMSETGETLQGAHVTIRNTTLGAATGKDGNYELSGLRNGDYTIRVSYFGLQTVEEVITVTGSDLVLDFAMTETSIDLNVVVVTGTRTEKNLKNVPVLTQTIHNRDLQKRNIIDITEALETVVPAVEFKSTAWGKSLTMAGIDPQYVLFLINGERMAGETFGDMDYSRINLADIEQLEVVKGAASTLYGSNALGGVVNIITRKPAEPFSVSASARYSDFNTQNYRLSTGSKFGKFSNQLAAGFDKTDGYDLTDANSYRTQEREDVFILSDRLRFAPSARWEMEGQVSFFSKNRDNTSASLYDRRNQDIMYGGKSSYFINSKSSITLSWNSDNYKLFNKVTPDLLETDYDNKYNNGRILGHFELSPRNNLVAGAEYISENLTAPRNQIEQKSNTDWVVFVQEDLKVSERVSITAGLRANHNEIYKWNLTPQATAMYKIWVLTLRGAYAQGYKTPTLKEKYMYFQIPVPGPPMFLTGNENLEPEKSNYFSFSTEYARDGVTWSVSAYHNRIKNLIAASDTFVVKPGRIIEYAYENQSEATIKGIDFMLRSKITRQFTASANIAFVKKVNEATGKEYSNTRKFLAGTNLDYYREFGNYNLNMNLQGNFFGKNQLDLMDERTREVTRLNLKSFSLWKFNTTHTFNSSYHVKLGVHNIFDFVDETGGYNSGTPGRTFMVGIGIRF
jgi:outer membrane receptor for ferrienterochelin and colicins